MNDKITFEIKAHLGVIESHSTGWNKELNLVSWNNGPVKFDIRDWDGEHEHMSRGITLSEKEMAKMMDIVSDRVQDIKEVFDQAKAKKKTEIDMER